MSSDIIFGKESIVSALNKAVSDVNNLVKGMNKDAFEFPPQGKWNAGQQLDHLIRSMKPLNLAYALPVFILRWRFGKANRPSKTYSGLVEKYESKLIGGGRATSSSWWKAIRSTIRPSITSSIRCRFLPRLRRSPRQEAIERA